MQFDPAIHNRRSIRLSGFDYSRPGHYFVTFAVREMECIFGEVAGGKVVLSDFGKIADEEWQRTFELRPELAKDAYVIMPNHIHGIIRIKTQMERPRGSRLSIPGTPAGTIGAIMAQYKTIVTKRVNHLRRIQGRTLWHRNYYESVIRDDQALERIRNYISKNPAKWEQDKFNPKFLGL